MSILCCIIIEKDFHLLERIMTNLFSQTISNWNLLIICTDQPLYNKFDDLQLKYNKNKNLFFQKCIHKQSLNHMVRFFLDNSYSHLCLMNNHDKYYPNFLKFLLEKNNHFVYGNYHEKTSGTNPSIIYKKKKDLEENYNYLCNTMWSKDAIQRIGNFDNSNYGVALHNYYVRTFTVLKPEEISYIHIALNTCLCDFFRTTPYMKKQKITVLYCLRNSSSYIDFMIKKYPLIEETYKNRYELEYYLYENNSTDDTKEKMKKFKNSVKGKTTVFSQDIKNLKKYSGISLERGAHVRNMRNQFKQLCGKLNSDYVFYIDDDVFFEINIIEQLISYMKNDIKMVVSNGILSDPRSYPYHHYDTLAFSSMKGETYFETSNTCLNKLCQMCIETRTLQSVKLPDDYVLDFDNNDTIELNTGFGSCSLIETNIFNEVNFTNKNEKNLMLEWPSLCRNIREKKGKIILATKVKPVVMFRSDLEICK